MEILSPAGNMECLNAALRTGADAVYLGLSEFNARKNAANFTRDEFKKAVSLCRLSGAKCYLTLNTLIKNGELESALGAAAFAYECGCDAVIVQDLGLLSLLHNKLPDFPLHASTQMSVHSPAALDVLKEMGVRRVVLARECSQKQIEDICSAARRLGMQTEVFVHGALCMSVSGQCYMSAALGGRSANRGLCAGSCRLPFSATGGGNDYDLSLKDLCLIKHVDELKNIGVDSIKIEGRMKGPEYVAAATYCYRSALDGLLGTHHWPSGQNLPFGAKQDGSYAAGRRETEKSKTVKDQTGKGETVKGQTGKGQTGKGQTSKGETGNALSLKSAEQAEKLLGDVFSRGGFTDGYFTGRTGKNMFGVRSEEDKAVSSEVKNRLHELYRRPRPAVPVDMHLKLIRGSAALLSAKCEGITYTVYGEPPETAKNAPLTADRARDVLGRLGGSVYYLNSFESEIDDGIFYSGLNRLKKEIVTKMDQRRSAAGRPPKNIEFTALQNDAAIKTEDKKSCTPANAAAALNNRAVLSSQYAGVCVKPEPTLTDYDANSAPSAPGTKPFAPTATLKTAAEAKETADGAKETIIRGQKAAAEDQEAAKTTIITTGAQKSADGPKETATRPQKSAEAEGSGELKLIIKLRDPSQLPDNLDEDDMVCLPLKYLDRPQRANTAAYLPRGIADERKLIKDMERAKEGGIDWAVCGNLGHIKPAKQLGFRLIAGFSMNIYNSLCLGALEKSGFERAVLSPELSNKELFSGGIETGIFAYGRLPLMLCRNCPINKSDCSGCRHTIKDRLSKTFPVVCQDGFCEILNSSPTFIAHPGADFYFLSFETETREEVKSIVSNFKKGIVPKNGKFTSALYRNGVL